MLNDLLNNIKEFFIKLGDTLYYIFNDLFLFIFDSVMSAVLLLVNALTELLEFMNFSEYYEMLPSEITEAAAAVGVGQAFGILLSAHFIKLLLQLIPFVRLGAK